MCFFRTLFHLFFRSKLYDPLPEGWIRLLIVIKGDDEVVCKLRATQLSPSLNFEAVSYAWGTEDRTEPIHCNDKRVWVTPTLKELLQHLYRYNLNQDRWSSDVPLRVLWIDALCINQEDPQEKAVQIRMMSSIFAGAPRAIVWLGPSGRYTDSFFKEASVVLKTLEDGSHVCPFHWEHRNPGLFDEEIGPVWSGLREILDREWSFRLWTFQEAVLARDSVVMCGAYSIDFTVLARIDGLLEEGPWDVNLFLEKQRNNRASPYCFPFKDIGLFRDLVQSEGKCPTSYVPDLLSHSYSLGSREPVDRIWSVFGLLDRNLQEELAPLVGYSDEDREHYWKTYMRFFKVLLKYDTRFEALSLSTYVPGQSTERPSWCPDLSAPILYRTFYFKHKHYRAGISNRSHGHRHGTGVRIPNVDDDNDKILEIPGFRIATVERTVKDTSAQQNPYNISDPARVEDWVSWESQCRDLAQEVHQSNDNTPPCYFRVHAGDGVSNASSIYSDFGNHVMTRFFVLAQEKYFSPLDDANATRSVWPAASEALRQTCSEEGLSGETRRLLGQCCEVIERNTGRTFFSTVDGHLGLGPPHMEPGDIVCVLYGSRPLHVLRFMKTQSSGADYATYIGDAYVDGLMELDELEGSLKEPDEVFRMR